MDNTNEKLLSVLLGKLVTKHPQLADELEEILYTLPNATRGRLYQSIIQHPSEIDLSDVLNEDLAYQPLSLLSADDILTTQWPEPVWAVPGFLPVGLSILAGAPKVGKSWLALQLTQSISSGGVFFGENIEQGITLYLALEDSPQRLKNRMIAQNWSIGLPAEFLPLGQFGTQIGYLTNGGGERLARQIELKGYRLVVIDTFSRAIPTKQKEVEDMTEALTPIQEMAHQTNCVVMLIDHHRKYGGNNPDAIADILGSTAKGAMVDTAWGLYRERGKKGAKLAITGRDIDEQTLILTFDTLTMSWQCEGDEAELSITQRRQEILQVLEDLGKAQVGMIAEEVSQPKGNTHKRLQDLVNSGIVRRIEEDGKVYYELN